MTNATTLPADVLITDLPAAGTVTGAELFEAVQTSGGVGASVQVSLSSMLISSVGALPTGGATAAPLVKNSGTSYDASFKALDLSTSAAVTNILQAANITAINVATTGAGGVQGVLRVTNGGQGTSTLTANAVLLGNGASTLGFATIGTGGRVLIDQGAASDPAFTVIAGDITLSALGTATISTNAVSLAKFTQGTGLSVLGVAGAATANFTTIVGAANKVLAISSTGASTQFQTVSITLDGAIGSTQGQVLYRSATSWVFLSAGATGQLLQTQGAAANPLWVSGLSLVNRLTPSGVASTNDTSSLTAAYRNYAIVLENVCPATNTATLQMTVATSGSNFVSGGYVSLAQVNVSSVVITDTSTTVILLSGNRGGTAGVATTTVAGVSGVVWLQNPAATASRKQFDGQVNYITPGTSGTTTYARAEISGMFDSNSNAVTGINFAFASGNIATGVISIYGMG